MVPFLLLLSACGDPDTTEKRSVPADVDTTLEATDTGGLGCDSETAAGSLPDGLVELAYDDDLGQAMLVGQEWAINNVVFDDTPLHEAVGFELEHPARIHGFAVQYGQLPPDATLTAGVYPDFGYNGFDFWHFDPYWTGTRCREDAEVGEWVTFTLEEPIDIDHPGLVYVAHRREEAADAAWLFDISAQGDGTCAAFDDCHSAMNLPELTSFRLDGARYLFWAGYSFPLQYDYMVRLYVEYTDDVADEARMLQPVEGISPSTRQSWGDYDNDGYDDLFTNGPALYRNNGDGTFSDVTDETGISAMGIAASGGVWGDYDNDGCLDLFVFAESGTSGDSLLRNTCGGGFSDVTVAAGLLDAQKDNDCAGQGYTTSPTPGAAWLDANNDGNLDLYLSNFICWDDYSYFTDTVFYSNGDGTFTEVTGTSGFVSSAYAGRGASPVDHDQDGDVDLLVNNYVLHPNLFFENQGDGTFTESAAARGLGGVSVDGYYGHTIGAAWGDLDNDGDFDVVQANLAHPRFFDFSDKTQVLLNDGAGNYTDAQGDWSQPVGATGLRYQETHSVPVLGDFDNDGALDLAISAVYDGRPSDFYWGNGDGTFRLDNYTVGLSRENGWGMAVSDIDNDGDLDLAALGAVYQSTPADPGRWLQVRPIGITSNRAGIGATVRVYAGGQRWLRHIGGGTGQGNQDSLIAHVGLGDLDTVERIEVDFPGAGTVSFAGPFDADQRLWLREDGGVSVGWAPPE